jgi:uncharacterized protein YndB with AHSA1/START domain
MSPTHRTLPADIHHAVFIRTDAARAYDALTIPEQVDAWFTCGASGEPVRGGTLTWRWQAWGPDRITAEDTLVVQEAERPNRFVFAWHPLGPEQPTTVAVTFEPVEGGTVVRLREGGYPDTEPGLKACLDCASGWGEALTLLKFYLEHGLSY